MRVPSPPSRSGYRQVFLTNGEKNETRQDHTTEIRRGDDRRRLRRDDRAAHPARRAGGQGASGASELVGGGENIVALADVDFGYVDKAVAERTKERDGKPNEQ